MGKKLAEAFSMMRDVMREGNMEYAKRVMEIEDEIDKYEEKIKKHHIKRLKKGECTASASTLFTDLITMCERVADHTANIAALALRGDLQ